MRSGMAASASTRAVRSSPSGRASICSSSSPTDPSTEARSASTSGWSNQRNRTLRARSPTIGKRSWVAVTSRSSSSRAAASSAAQRAPARRASAAGSRWPSGPRAPSAAGRGTPGTRPPRGSAALEIGHAVVPQHPLEPSQEVGRQRTALGVEALQVGVEVLARAVHLVLDVGLLADRPVAAQLGEVGEDGQQVHLVGDRRPPGRGQLVAGLQVAGQGARLVSRVEVVAEQHRREVGAGVHGTLGRRHRR